MDSPIEIPRANVERRNRAQYVQALVQLSQHLDWSRLAVRQSEIVQNEPGARLVRQILGFQRDPDGNRGAIYAETKLEGGWITQRIRYQFEAAGVWIVAIGSQFAQDGDRSGYANDEEYLLAYLGTHRLIAEVTAWAIEALDNP